MPKNKLEDLRNHLFETIERLKDEDKPMDIARAKAVAEVAGVILDSAKVEIGYMRVADAAMESEFIGPTTPRLPASTHVPGRRELAAKTEHETPAADGTGRVQCIDCGEKFPDAKALGIHRSRVHFSDRSLTGSGLGHIAK